MEYEEVGDRIGVVLVDWGQAPEALFLRETEHQGPDPGGCPPREWGSLVGAGQVGSAGPGSLFGGGPLGTLHEHKEGEEQREEHRRPAHPLDGIDDRSGPPEGIVRV